MLISVMFRNLMEHILIYGIKHQMTLIFKTKAMVDCEWDEERPHISTAYEIAASAQALPVTVMCIKHSTLGGERQYVSHDHKQLC